MTYAFFTFSMRYDAQGGAKNTVFSPSTPEKGGAHGLKC